MSLNILTFINRYKSLAVAFLLMFAIALSFGSNVLTHAQLTPDRTNLCPNGNCPVTGSNDFSNTDQNTIVEFIIGIAQFLTFISVALAILFMVYGGIRYITAGNADGNESGKKILINATIGLIVSIVAYTVVSVISGLVQGDLLSNL